MKSFLRYTAILFLLKTANAKAPFLPCIDRPKIKQQTSPLVEYIKVIKNSEDSGSRQLCWYQTVLFGLFYEVDAHDSIVDMRTLTNIARPLMEYDAKEAILGKIANHSELLESIFEQTQASFFMENNVKGLFSDVFIAYLAAFAKANYQPSQATTEELDALKRIYSKIGLIKIFGRYPTLKTDYYSTATPILTLRTSRITKEEKNTQYYYDLLAGFGPFERLSKEYLVFYGDGPSRHEVFAQVKRSGTKVTSLKIFDSSDVHNENLVKRLVKRVEELLIDLKKAERERYQNLWDLEPTRSLRQRSLLAKDVDYIKLIRQQHASAMPPIN